MKCYFFLGCILFLGCQQWTFAQESSLEQLTGVFASRYMDSVTNRSTLFYGKLQEPYWVATSNQPYFKESKYVKGRLCYGNAIYPDVPLRWDLYRDELITLSPDNYNVVLVPDKMKDTELNGYHIWYLSRDSLKDGPQAGYYMILHQEHCFVLAKQTAIQQQKTYQQKIEHYYSFTTKYYLKKDGIYYLVKNKNTLLNALGSYHKELKQFIRVNKFNFRRDAETMIVAVVKEYEKLNNQ